MKKVKLPNGKIIFSENWGEARSLYDSVPEYLNHGIEIRSGDIVFDIGAHIGMFALWIYWNISQSIHVHCFEPIPKTFDILTKNINLLGDDIISTYNYGLSSSNKLESYFYYPELPSMSSRYPSDTLVDIDELVNCFLVNLDDAPKITKVLYMLPRGLRKKLLDRIFNKGLNNFTRHSCVSKSLSSIIYQLNIEHIDLLKIDAEGSELDILTGISLHHWKLIKQIVMEVHDIDNRIDEIQSILSNNGFNVISISQEPLFSGSKIFSLVALH